MTLVIFEEALFAVECSPHSLEIISLVLVDNLLSANVVRDVVRLDMV